MYNPEEVRKARRANVAEGVELDEVARAAIGTVVDRFLHLRETSTEGTNGPGPGGSWPAEALSLGWPEDYEAGGPTGDDLNLGVATSLTSRRALAAAVLNDLAVEVLATRKPTEAERRAEAEACAVRLLLRSDFAAESVRRAVVEGVDVVVFRDGDVVVAQGVDLEVASQGESEGEALDHLASMITVDRHVRSTDGGFAPAPAAPGVFRILWRMARPDAGGTGGACDPRSEPASRGPRQPSKPSLEALRVAILYVLGTLGARSEDDLGAAMAGHLGAHFDYEDALSGLVDEGQVTYETNEYLQQEVYSIATTDPA